METRRRQLSLDDYVQGFRSGNRTILSRAITLVESLKSEDRELSHQLMQRLLKDIKPANRIGITGTPGVGKSTFIERFGKHLTQQGRTVAVLAIDPSSQRSGGSILGDKTRMHELAVDEKAFIRPSPSSGSLGGVHFKTRESILLCEAFGFDTILVETVGVGQGEYAVASMVDTFLLLVLPGGGDELQGIKRGILELADVIVVNKADRYPEQVAHTTRDLVAAFRYLQPKYQEWQTRILKASGLKGEGLGDICAAIQEFRKIMIQSGQFAKNRQLQTKEWMWRMVDELVLRKFRERTHQSPLVQRLEKEVLSGIVSPSEAAFRIASLGFSSPEQN